MMDLNLPCEPMVKNVLPVFRSSVAKALVEEYNLTQMKAAKKLGTTQAAISQYLHSKRGFKGIENCGVIFPLIQSAANETAKRIVKEEIEVKGVMVDFCKLCTSLREKQKLK